MPEKPSPDVSRWAAPVYTFTVSIPALVFCNEMGWSPAQIGPLPFSPWAILPCVGGAASGFLLMRRHPFLGAICGTMGGFFSFWASCHWASGSRDPYVYEIVLTGFVGLIPAALLYLMVNGILFTPRRGPSPR